MLGSPGATEGAGGLQLTLRDERFEVVDTTTTSPDGRFALSLPSPGGIHLEVAGEGHVPVSFAGGSGKGPVLEVAEDELWAFPVPLAEAWRARFTGCPGADAAGAMIIGELRVDLTNEENPLGLLWPNSFAFRSSLEGPEVDRQDACYLDHDGIYDPELVGTRCDAEATTDCLTAFGIFEVEPGPGLITAGQYTTSGSLLDRFEVWVPEGGAVTLLPAYVPL